MKILSKTNFYFLLALLVFIPFQGIFVKILNAYLNSATVFWLAHWYEPVTLILLALTVPGMVYKKMSLGFYSAIAGLILLLGVLLVFMGPPGVERGIEGFRFTLFPILLFLLVLNSFFTKSQKNILISTYLVISALVAIWALVERFLPAFYWSTIGLSNFGFGNFLAGGYVRSASVIGAPNQMGSFLIPAVFLFADKIRIPFKKLSVFYLLLTVIAALATIFSFSRAAILGLAVALFFYLFRLTKGLKMKAVFLLFSIVLIVVCFFVIKSNSSIAEGFVTHGSSQYWHQKAMVQSLNNFSNRDLATKIFGGGLGTDGPILLKYQENRFSSESWYIQLLLEIGIIGLLLWLGLVGLILGRAYRQEKAIFFGFLGVLVTALFLHPFADNPAMAYSLFVLAGFLINAEEKHEKNIN